MSARNKKPLGFQSARHVVQLGRAAFFGTEDADLPLGRGPERESDDRTPSFGYIGAEYPTARVLFLGINPGNGPNGKRHRSDEYMMPPLKEFVANPSPTTYLRAGEAYKSACETWPIWKRHCSAIIGAGKLTLDQIAYANCLPYRTESGSGFNDSVAERAASLYALPLIEELEPKVVVALGKRAAEILAFGKGDVPNLIVWNRAQAATQSVLQQRAEAAKKLFSLVRKPK